ncbi:MAG: hypothetical protein HUU50_18370 [Candidatus Brocadiae bacterium]|nr:hypothetical protein [Candidatus Brocadiia bacterium]
MKLQAESGFYTLVLSEAFASCKPSFRNQKNRYPIFLLAPGSRVESHFLICQAGLFLIPYRRLTLRSSYP